MRGVLGLNPEPHIRHHMISISKKLDVVAGDKLWDNCTEEEERALNVDDEENAYIISRVDLEAHITQVSLPLQAEATAEDSRLNESVWNTFYPDIPTFI